MNTKAGELDGAAAEQAPDAANPRRRVHELVKASNSSYCSYAAPGFSRASSQCPAGFNQVELLLAGCSLATDSRGAPVNRARVYVQRFRYDAQDLEVGMAAELVTDGRAGTAK